MCYIVGAIQHGDARVGHAPGARAQLPVGVREEGAAAGAVPLRRGVPDGRRAAH